MTDIMKRDESEFWTWLAADNQVEAVATALYEISRPIEPRPDYLDFCRFLARGLVERFYIKRKLSAKGGK